MTWIDRKDEMDTSGGRLKGLAEKPSGKGRRNKPDDEKCYSLGRVAVMMGVDRRTVYRWVAPEAPEEAVIPAEGWFRLPSGHIRIRGWVVAKMQKGG